MRHDLSWGKEAVKCGATLLALLMLGCTAAKDSRTRPAIAPDEERADTIYRLECDKISGETVCVMVGNPLLPQTPRYPLLSLGAMRKDKANAGGSEFYLRLVYVNQRTWMHIGEGPSLRLTIDGATQALAGEGSAPQRIQGESGKVFEVALYPVSLEVLKGIAGARQVSVRVEGDFVLEKHFTSGNQIFFAMFVRKYSGGSLEPGN